MLLNTGIMIVIRGAGDLASGVAHRLFRCGFRPVMTELPMPLVVRRTVSFAQAVFDGAAEVEGVRAVLANTVNEADKIRGQGGIPVIVDPQGDVITGLSPYVLVDGIMAKNNTVTKITDAPIVIGLGPGFNAGVDVHAVVETKRGHDLGRVIWRGSAIPNTGVPGVVAGESANRLLKSPAEGIFKSVKKIRESVSPGETVGFVSGYPVNVQISGVLRGLVADGCRVTENLKIGDVDPRAIREHCDTISDKARAIGGGVLEAILALANRQS